MMNDRPLILVAADDAELRTRFYAVLEFEGYRVATLRNDTETLRYVSEFKPELVILGVPTPEQPAEELVGRLKSISPQTSVLLLADASKAGSTDGPMERGADERVLQPCRDETVVRAVDRLLGRVNTN